MTENGCVFCRIVAGTEPAHVVFANDEVVAFLDAAPATEGHTLVVPRVHCRNLLDASDEIASGLAVGTRDVARLLVRSLGASGVTVFQANEPDGWQEVFHLHVHVVPRHRGDRLALPWGAEEVAAHDAAATWRRIVNGQSGADGR